MSHPTARRGIRIMGAERRWVRIVPLALVMYTIAFIDRTNISMALPSITHTFRMTPAEAGGRWGFLLGLPSVAGAWMAFSKPLEPQTAHCHLVDALGSVRDRLRSCEHLA